MRPEPSRVRHGPQLALALVLLAAIGSLPAARGAAQPAAPLLVLVSVDGLQPDYVTAADAHGAVIPNLRRMLRDGAFAEGVEGVIPTVTYPSHTTLITGVWPAKHGILANTTFDPRRENKDGWYWYAEDIDMRDIAPTLARRLGLSLPAAEGRILLP